jgi:hypothetical protein
MRATVKDAPKGMAVLASRTVPLMGRSAVVLEVVFGVEAAGGSGLGIPNESNREEHAERRGGLDLESGAVNGKSLP